VPSIGRVINDKNHRGKGLGKLLMQKAIESSMTLFNTNTIKIAAQTYLFKFYSELGFKAFGEPYDEDGIEHVDMFYTHHKA
jgi:ElaA protein